MHSRKKRKKIQKLLGRIYKMRYEAPKGNNVSEIVAHVLKMGNFKVRISNLIGHTPKPSFKNGGVSYN
jgi:hypothetical protein